MFGSVTRRVDSILRSVKELRRNVNVVRSFTLGASLKKEEDNKNEPTIKIKLTEELPPIPPNYGFPGDENLKTYFELKRIKDSFEIGNPPQLGRRLNPGPLVMRLLPISTCRNRKFYRIAVTRMNYETSDGYLEDVGSLDPMPNKNNKILVALNIDRIKYYLSRSVMAKGVVAQILGLSGLLPVHPKSYQTAFRNRKKLAQQTDEPNAEEAKQA